MQSIIASPGRYIQGKNALEDLCTHAGKLGKSLFVLVSKSGKGRVEQAVARSAAAAGCTVEYAIFNGECSKGEIDRLGKLYKASGCQVVIGIGGGKILDTAKAVAHYHGVPVVIVPTIASTDAPCSALSVIYTEEGAFQEYLFLPSSPNLVLVDTEIVASAPVRLLVAGMGDALATYFEARACVRSDSGNCVGGKATLAAAALAELCYNTLLENGFAAKLAVEQTVCTKAVEAVIEANTLLSGLGFESAGLAGAHAIHNGLTALEETHAMYHGEKVAFGTLVQLVLENATDDIETVLHFCREIDLPVTLGQLGVDKIDPARLMEVATLACAETDTMGNLPFAVTAEDVYAAILSADALGKAFL
ncbi:glycerol dehydrogenase [Ruminococcaceae bacterium OttesenSCG-928-L11]|nr:glycerol dehydrogenase [Ruminococcaceae bacterium OttesenSCG-928-L11]